MKLRAIRARDFVEPPGADLGRVSAESEGVTGEGLADPVVLPVGTPAGRLEQRFRYEAADRGSWRTSPDVDGIVDPSEP